MGKKIPGKYVPTSIPKEVRNKNQLSNVFISVVNIFNDCHHDKDEIL